LSLAALKQRHGYADLSASELDLSASELKVFSQNGEDGVLAEIFSRIGTTNRFFVEFGVGDGVECNTRMLMEVLGWSGVYFEPVASEFDRLSTRLAARDDVRTIRAFLTPTNIADSFGKVDIPLEPDLLSIDIDGQDYWLWRALDHYRPRVVIIEYNSSLPPAARLVEREGTVHEEDQSSYFGASLGALRALGERKGYKLVHAELAGVNLFFVRDDLAGRFEEPLLRGPNFFLRGQRHRPATGDYVEV